MWLATPHYVTFAFRKAKPKTPISTAASTFPEPKNTMSGQGSGQGSGQSYSGPPSVQGPWLSVPAVDTRGRITTPPRQQPTETMAYGTQPYQIHDSYAQSPVQNVTVAGAPGAQYLSPIAPQRADVNTPRIDVPAVLECWKHRIKALSQYEYARPPTLGLLRWSHVEVGWIRPLATQNYANTGWLTSWTQ